MTGKKNNKPNHTTLQSRKSSRGVREMIAKDESGQDYAIVLRKLGDSRMEVRCSSDCSTRIGRVRGNMRWKHHKVWVNVGDIILVGLRDSIGEVDKVDIIHKYNDKESRQLRKTERGLEITGDHSDKLDSVGAVEAEESFEFVDDFDQI